MHLLFKRIALWFALAGGLAASALALLTVVSIVGRAGWSTPIQGDVEMMQMGIALSISLSLPWCQLHGSNIIVDFFTQNLGQRSNRRLDGIGALMLALMCALLAWRTGAGAIAVQAADEQTMIIGLPMWWAYAMLAPGLALTALIALWQAQRLLRGLDAMAVAESEAAAATAGAAGAVR
ncbi:MAG: TRAP transporter small permease [Burkholderiaceae bacterium]|nr:TRAP transporter small permease [Burkholderiaceae bacterium]